MTRWYRTCTTAACRRTWSSRSSDRWSCGRGRGSRTGSWDIRSIRTELSVLICVQNELFEDFHFVALLGALATSVTLAICGCISQPNVLRGSIAATTMIHQLVHLLHRPITHSDTLHLMGNGLVRSFACNTRETTGKCHQRMMDDAGVPSLHKSHTKVLNFTHTLPNPIPRWPGVPQLGHTMLLSNRRSFFRIASGVSPDLLAISIHCKNVFVFYCCSCSSEQLY